MGLHAHPNDQGWLSGVITLVQGTKIHGPLQWHGERYALVFYSRFTAANTSTHIREELLRLKFPL